MTDALLPVATPQLPPGPRGRLRSTVRFAFAPLPALAAWRSRYGDPFTVPAVNGDVVTTGRPELIRAIFAADPDRYDPFGVDAAAPLLGPQAIFFTQGAEHRQQRRQLQPSFIGARMRAYAETFREVTTSHLERATGDEPVRMLDVAQAVSLEVIIRAIFGFSEPEDVRAIGEATRRMVHAVRPLVLFVPALQREWRGVGLMAPLKRAKARVDELLQSRIERARQAPGEDILSRLVTNELPDQPALDDDTLKAHLRTLLFAGHETTAISLAWAVELLGRHQEWQGRLRDEIDGGRADALLTAVVYEVLRLHPPLSEVLRSLREPMRLGEWTLPSGAVVSPSIHLLHRDPDVYPRPDAFEPERFLDEKPRPDHFIPFGGGHRRCLGAAFAQLELTEALRALVSGYTWTLTSKRPSRPARRNITLAPHDGVPVRLTARLPKMPKVPVVRSSAHCGMARRP